MSFSGMLKVAITALLLLPHENKISPILLTRALPQNHTTEIYHEHSVSKTMKEHTDHF